MLFDMHCHLDLFQNMVSVISESSKERMGIFAVGTTPKAYLHDVNFCRNNVNIYVGLGFHPQLVSLRYNEFSLFEQLSFKSKYIGEVGLDFNNAYIESKDRQIEVFSRIIDLCEKQKNKVVSIHAVKATSTILDIIEKQKIGSTNKYIFHWFTGSLEQLKRAINMNMYFSINPKMLTTASGILAIKNIPKDKMLLETDAPFSMPAYTASDLHHGLKELSNSLSLIVGYDVYKATVKAAQTVMRSIPNSV